MKLVLCEESGWDCDCDVHGMDCDVDFDVVGSLFLAERISGEVMGLIGSAFQEQLHFIM